MNTDFDDSFRIKVIDYSSFSLLVDNLPVLVKNACDSRNDRFSYLNDYLHSIGCRTVVIEDCYVDRNFLEDYSRYYSKCFQDYPKKCVRTHFFASAFRKKKLLNRVRKGSPGENDFLHKAGYLGFIVFRPLPNAPLAKVCLAANSPNREFNCFFPILKDYHVHFLGTELVVKSLAFQEQDRALSACATSALWSSFHGAGSLDVNSVSAPSRITENAKKIIPQLASNYPHRGLTPAQMSNSVREEGLEPLHCNFINTSYLKALLRAYLSVGVTPVLGMSLYYADDQGDLTNGISRSKPLGDHAVAVAGYNVSNNEILPFKTDEIGTSIPLKLRKYMYLRSSAIDKIYVHDDEVGPFAEMEFGDEYWQHLKTSWFNYRESPDEINATVRDVLLPKPHKIRIRFNTIFSIIREFNSLYMGGWYEENKGKIVWDIYITTVNDFKRDIGLRDFSYFIKPEHKIEILTLNLPRYIWCVDGYMLDKGTRKLKKKSFTFIFDATEIENSDLFMCAIHYDIISRVNILLSVLNPILSQLNQISKFSQSHRIAEEYIDIKSKKVLS